MTKQLKHVQTKKPEDPAVIRANLEKKAKGFKWQTGVSLFGTATVAVALAIAGRDCCGTKPAPICEPPQTTVKLPTADELRYNGICDKNALIQVRDTVRSSAGCDSVIVVDTARYTESSDPNSPNYCSDCKPAQKKASKPKPKPAPPAPRAQAQEPGCVPCDGSIAGSENIAMTLTGRAINKTAGSVNDVKNALGVARGQSVTITYLIEVDELGSMRLKGTTATSGDKTLDASMVPGITGFSVTGTTGRPGVKCCTVPISVVLPAEY